MSHNTSNAPDKHPRQIWIKIKIKRDLKFIMRIKETLVKFEIYFWYNQKLIKYNGQGVNDKTLSGKNYKGLCDVFIFIKRVS